MDSSTEKPDEVDLELPALDGEEDSVAFGEFGVDTLDVTDEGGDPFDDATSDGTPYEELAVEGAEGGWLVDADTAATLDLGGFDVVIRPEDNEEAKGTLLEDEEVSGFMGADDLVSDDERTVADGGEEGPLDDDEELREEDLPALDADEDGDVADDELFDRAMLVADDELRWDDRAWARVTDVMLDAPQNSEADDSGILAVPGEDPAHASRDVTWKRLEETTRMMAAAFLPGGGVVVALASSDRTRARVVRIQADGDASIIAEVEPRPTKEDDDACTVTFIRWDATRGCLFVGGNFGVEAYRPA